MKQNSKTTISDKLIKKIIEFRKVTGISLSELARKAGISKAYLSQLEQGISYKPSFDVAVKLMNTCFIDYKKLKNDTKR